MHNRLIFISFTISLICTYHAAYSQSYYAGEPGQKLDWALYYLNTEYVDSVNSEELAEAAIKAIVSQLDPYSTYQTKEELNSQQGRDKGHSYVGVGINFIILEDTVQITNVVPFGPASKAGIQVGDKILKADNQSLVGVSEQEVVESLRGDKDTKVTVEIWRPLSGKKICAVTRDNIPMVEIPASYLAKPGVGYIKVSNFTLNTVGKFRDSLQALLVSGARDLILDLRGNPGGLVKAAVALSDVFLEEGKLVVYTKGFSMDRKDHVTTEVATSRVGKLIVLIDRQTASASEIVAGALQDWDRCLIIGQESFGKGLVQQSYLLGDGSAIRITIGRYYTPAGRYIQRPSVAGAFLDKKISFEEAPNGIVKDLSIPDSLREYSLHKRPLIGGGGICPDIYLPVDSSFSSTSFTKLSYDAELYGLCQSYISRSGPDLRLQFSNAKDFSRDQKISDELWVQLEGRVADRQLILSDFEAKKEELLKQMKAWVATGLWGHNAFYQLMNEHSPVFQRALQEIGNDASFRSHKIRY